MKLAAPLSEERARELAEAKDRELRGEFMRLTDFVVAILEAKSLKAAKSLARKALEGNPDE